MKGLASLDRRTFTRSLICGCLLLWGFLPFTLFGAEDKEAVAAAEALLRDRGASAEVAGKLARALTEADEKGSIVPLLPLMEDQDIAAAVVAGGAAIYIDPKVATAHVAKLLREKRGVPEALLLSLFASTRRDTVKFLVEELAAARGADREQAALFSLRVITGQQFTSTEEWAAWWKKQTPKKKITFPKDEQDLERRTLAAAAVLRSAKLRAAVGRAGNDDARKADPNRQVSEFAKLLEQGGGMQLSPAALEGDRAFSLGEIEDAVEAYARAQKKNPRDHRSAYLRGCGLFELGRRDQARKVFEAIEAADPKAVAAYFMARLCKLPAGKPLLPAAREELNTTVLFRGDVYGWDDPVLAALLAQQLAGVGPRYIPQDALDELILDNPDDLELRCGIAQCRPRVVMHQAYAALREKFPNEVLPICGWLSASRGSGAKADPAALVTAATRWRELEPRNGVPALLVFALQSPRERGVKGLQPFDDETVGAVMAAARLPDFDNRGREICQGVRHVLEVTEHPFPLAEIVHRPTFENEMFNVLSRLLDTEIAQFEAGEIERAAQIEEVVDALVSRLRATGGNRRLDPVLDSIMTVALERRRARWMATGAAGEALETLEVRIQALTSVDKKRAAARQKTLELLSLPSLEREIVDEELAGTPTAPGSR